MSTGNNGRRPMSEYGRALAESAAAYLAWEQETAVPLFRRPRMRQLGERYWVIEDEDDWGRPTTRVVRDEEP